MGPFPQSSMMNCHVFYSSPTFTCLYSACLFFLQQNFILVCYLLFFRRAPPRQCHYDPLPVRVKSNLIKFVPQESESTSITLWLLGSVENSLNLYHAVIYIVGQIIFKLFFNHSSTSINQHRATKEKWGCATTHSVHWLAQRAYRQFGWSRTRPNHPFANHNYTKNTQTFKAKRQAQKGQAQSAGCAWAPEWSGKTGWGWTRPKWPWTGGNLHRRGVGHRVWWPMDHQECCSGLPTARFPVRSKGSQEFRVWRGEGSADSSWWCSVWWDWVQPAELQTQWCGVT